jgi:phosphopantetheinyl transferase
MPASESTWSTCARGEILLPSSSCIWVRRRPASLPGFYRAWTFGEAYFKAFGSPPGKETLAHVIEHHAGNGSYRLRHRENGAIGVLHSEVNGEFALTLVWGTELSKP